MPRTARRDAPEVLSIAFNRFKYGRELLVDAAYIADMPLFNRTSRPHRLDFFDVVLVTKGGGTFSSDGLVHEVSPGTLIVSRPGDVRQWKVPDLDGAVMFFAPDFFTEVFRDAHFLDQFDCFHPRRRSSAVALNARERRQFLARFTEMQREIAADGQHAMHALRALTYQLLAMLTRVFTRQHGSVMDVERDELLEQFRMLIEERFSEWHGVAPYAGALGVTPRYLSDRCRRAGLMGAGAHVHTRIALEAKRMLLYTDAPVGQVGRSLGFEDPAYFARFFRREAGASPAVYRSKHRHALPRLRHGKHL